MRDRTRREQAGIESRGVVPSRSSSRRSPRMTADAQARYFPAVPQNRIPARLPNRVGGVYSTRHGTAQPLEALWVNCAFYACTWSGRGWRRAWPWAPTRIGHTWDAAFGLAENGHAAALRARPELT
jgi:hypothetical protein